MAAADAAELRATQVPGLLKLAWPVAAETLLYMALFWIDSIIINHKLGTEAFAAVQIGGQIFNLLAYLLTVVAAGTSIVISHQIGAGELREAGSTAAQSIGAGILLSIGLGFVLLFAAPHLLTLLGAVGGAHAQGLVYMRVLALFTPTMLLINVLGAILRAMGDTKGPMSVTLVVNVLNLALNLLLVVGAPAFTIGGLHVPAVGGGMGLQGSALGMSLARAVGVVLLALMLRKSDLPVRLKRIFHFRGRNLWQVARMGVPGAFEGLTWEGGQFALSIIVAPLGTAMIAARGITFQTEWFSLVPGAALQTAVAIIIGQLMGAGRRAEAVAQGRRAMILGSVSMGVLGVVLWLFAPHIVGIFTSDAQVAGYAVGALRVSSLYKLGQCLNVVCGGIFRGAGNPQWPTWLTSLGTWLITVPLSWVAVHDGFGLRGVFMVMFIDETVRGLINLWYFTTPKWRHRTV